MWWIKRNVCFASAHLGWPSKEITVLRSYESPKVITSSKYWRYVMLNLEMRFAVENAWNWWRIKWKPAFFLKCIFASMIIIETGRRWSTFLKNQIHKLMKACNHECDQSQYSENTAITGLVYVKIVQRNVQFIHRLATKELTKTLWIFLGIFKERLLR